MKARDDTFPRKFRRYDVKQVRRFHAMLDEHPVAGLLLCLLCVIAGVVLASDWAGHSAVRPSSIFRSWFGAGLWWLLALYLGVRSGRALWRRRQDPSEG